MFDRLRFAAGDKCDRLRSQSDFSPNLCSPTAMKPNVAVTLGEGGHLAAQPKSERSVSLSSASADGVARFLLTVIPRQRTSAISKNGCIFELHLLTLLTR